MSETDAGRIRDTLEAIALIRRYCSGVTQSVFLIEPQLQDAVIRRLIVIGEAAAKLSVSAKDHFSHVPWTAVIGMRNILVHDYGRAAADMVWRTVKDNLPVLEKDLRRG